MRNQILRSFESTASHPELVEDGATSVVIVGGGSTGVEVAGYLTDFLFDYSFVHDYPHLARDRMRITLVERGDRLLPGLHPKLSRYALDRLRNHGVDVRLNASVAEVRASGVTIVDGEEIPAATTVWAGGVCAPSWVRGPGFELQASRIVVDSDLRVPGREDVFAIGDVAAIRARNGMLVPQVAQLALQSGNHAARQILRLTRGERTEPFSYHDRGTMAMVGRNAAVMQAGPIRMTGVVAWIAWGVLHLAFLPGLVNRLGAAQKFLLWHLVRESSARVLLEERESKGVLRHHQRAAPRSVKREAAALGSDERHRG